MKNKIDKIKNWNQFLNEDKSLDYLKNIVMYCFLINFMNLMKI